MCGKQNFYLCKHCGNLIGLVLNGKTPLICCGEKMALLVPNTAEASQEKHLPLVSVENGIICAQAGSLAHPQTEEHHISFIYLETENGGQRKCVALEPAGLKPAAKFAVVDDKPIAVYAYCNLHGLWKTEI